MQRLLAGMDELPQRGHVRAMEAQIGSANQHRSHIEQMCRPLWLRQIGMPVTQHRPNWVWEEDQRQAVHPETGGVL
jgi:hypothetical protein